MADEVVIARRTFEQIAPQSWEHPADRAALQALRALPGFDQVVRHTLGFFGETGIRATFQADAVRVGPRQFAELDSLLRDVQRILDWPDEVPLFVSQTPWFNAGAYGVDRPFIVLNSATVDILEPDELKVVVAHELGHVMSGHALYRTMLALILEFGLRQMPFVTGIALLPIRLALQEWSRKSELSSDRAALLASGSVDHALSAFMKAAGGTIGRRYALSVDAYREQVQSYQSSGGAEAIFKLLNLLDRSHPYHTLRAAELLAWSESAGYRAILDGHYRRRGEAAPSGQFGSDVSEAASYYAQGARERVSELSQAARTLAQEATSHAKHAAVEAGEALRAAASDAAQRLAEALRRRER